MSELLIPGQIFAGRYRIDRFLARGGFGAVYVAEQIETELAVALKVLWPHVLHSQDAVEKFKLEARVAGRVGSEHIVKVFDTGFDAESGMPFLVMELLQGSHLQHLVESQGALQPELLVPYFRQIAAALDKAHLYVDRNGVAHPIVHRDLKPENLFLARREVGDAIVKILDFGIAKVLSQSTNVSQDVKGTPLYMAAEQAMAGKITPQTDIWALGLIAFYLLTGHCYWKTANLPEAALTQLFGEVLALPIDPPSQRARELGLEVVPNAAFDAWFGRCVNRDASLRFATAGECATALSSALLGRVASPQTSGSREAAGLAATTPLARHTVSTAARAVGATTAQPLSVGSSDGAPQVSKRGSLPVTAGLMIAAVVLLGVVAVRSFWPGSDAPAHEAASASSALVAPLQGTSPSVLEHAVGALSVPVEPSTARAATPSPVPSGSARTAPPASPTQTRASVSVAHTTPKPSSAASASAVKSAEMYDDR